jgi:hypothetical protein
MLPIIQALRVFLPIAYCQLPIEIHLIKTKESIYIDETY